MSVEMTISLHNNSDIWTIARWKNNQINKLWGEPKNGLHRLRQINKEDGTNILEERKNG